MSEQHPNAEDMPHPSMTNHEVYNVVSDTITGANVRPKDNLLQALATFLGVVLGALIGALVASDLATGVIFGGFLGLLVGLFGSGIFLMIFRAVRHARGRHD